MALDFDIGARLSPDAQLNYKLVGRKEVHAARDDEGKLVAVVWKIKSRDVFKADAVISCYNGKNISSIGLPCEHGNPDTAVRLALASYARFNKSLEPTAKQIAALPESRRVAHIYQDRSGNWNLLVYVHGHDYPRYIDGKSANELIQRARALGFLGYYVTPLKAAVRKSISGRRITYFATSVANKAKKTAKKRR